MHCIVATLACQANAEFFESIRYFKAAEFCSIHALKFEDLAIRMLDTKGASNHICDWDYLTFARQELHDSNCFDIARLSKMNKIINHETVQLKIEEIYYGGLSTRNRRHNLSFYLSCLSFGVLAPFLLYFKDGVYLSSNGMATDVFLLRDPRQLTYAIIL